MPTGPIAVITQTIDVRDIAVGMQAAGDAGPITVLIVDMDGVSRRFIELALERHGGFEVESALDGAGALEILAHTPVHAIVADTELIDMNGLQLFRRLATESRLRDIPFLFQSSDRRVATRVLAFEDGVDDFLVKPCDVDELVARIRAAVARRRRALAAGRRCSYMLAGRFAAMSLPDLVSMLEQSRRSGTLSVVGERSAGAVYFDSGSLVHARVGNLVGLPAFQELMQLEDAQFEFNQEPCPVTAGQRTIHGSATGVLIETARIIDTRRHEAERAAAVGLSRGRPRRTNQAIVVRRPQPAPQRLSAGVASQLAHGVGDAFALGDLCAYGRAALARWIGSEGGRVRFHVHLLADPEEAASAFLALAGAPSERWVVGSLSPEAKALGLAFSLRHELLVDVVHLDIFNPRSFLTSLTRVPSLLLVAPPAGDFLAIGVKARVEIEQLIARTTPAAVLGVGNQALEAALRSLPVLREHANLRTAQGVLGQGSCDLRSLLVGGIRQCTAEETTP